MDCTKAQEVLSAGVDCELILDLNVDPNSFANQQLAFDRHVEGCSSCAVRVRGLKNIKSLVRHHKRPETAPEGLYSRVLALLEKESSGGNEVDVVPFREHSSEQRRRSRPSGRGSLWYFIAAAALIVIGLGHLRLPQALVHAEVTEKALRAHHDGSDDRLHDVTSPTEGAGDFCIRLFGRATALPSFDGLVFQGCSEDRFGGYKAAHLLYALDGTLFSLFVMDNPRLVLGDSEPLRVMKDDVCQCQNEKDYMVRCCYIGDTYICVVVPSESEARVAELLTISVRAFKDKS